MHFIIQVSDETFLAKLNKHCIQHPHFESRASKKFLSDLSLPHDCFRLKHYAGSVSVKEQAPRCLIFFVSCFSSRKASSINAQNSLGRIDHANSFVFRFNFPSQALLMKT